MSNSHEQFVDQLENEVVALTLAMGDGYRDIAEQTVALRHGARTIVDMAMMALSPSETVGYPQLAVA